jgi:hypothetical protein
MQSAQCYRQSANVDSVLNCAIISGVLKHDDRFAAYRGVETKPLRGTSRYDRDNLRNVKKMHRPGRHRGWATVFSRANCLKCHTKLVSGWHGEALAGASYYGNSNWILSAASRHYEKCEKWNYPRYRREGRHTFDHLNLQGIFGASQPAESDAFPEPVCLTPIGLTTWTAKRGVRLHAFRAQ